MNVVSAGGQRQRITLGERIGRGTEAEVFDVVDFAGCAAKIYSEPPDKVMARRAKLETMLARPPEKKSISAAGKELPLLAWPTHVLEDDAGRFTGFLMPKVMAKLPQDEAVSLVTYMSRTEMAKALTNNDRSLPWRLLVCRNLAGVTADLHRQGHYVVDFKPQNIDVFKNTGIPCLLDTDSFSIAPLEGPRFPARMYTPEYACRELLENKVGPSGVADDLQDRFALAVLMFQLLNKGIHPFQGVPVTEREHNTCEQAIRDGHYAYGLAANRDIGPMPGSDHDCLSRQTRALFDRAFQSDSPKLRPTAMEWKDHLERLRNTASEFAKCERKPDEVLHIHFAQLACPECRYEAQKKIPEQSSELSGLAKFLKALALIGALALGVAWLSGRFPQTETRPATVVPGPASSAERDAPSAKTRVEPQPNEPVPTRAAPDDAEVARAMQSATDADGLRARQAILSLAIRDAVSANSDEMYALMRQAAAREGDVAERMATVMRNTGYLSHFSGWRLFAREAKETNEKTLASYHGNLQQALHQQWIALAQNPYNREVAGNLGYYVAFNKDAPSALSFAIYALSLPRKEKDPIRLADWQLVGSALAMSGRADTALGAYAAALARTNNPEGFCTSLLKQRADFGESLKVSIQQAFERVPERVSPVPSACSLPIR